MLKLRKDAFLNDFANGVDPVKARTLYAVQQPNVATIEIDAGHLSLVSHVQDVSDLILKAAA